MVGANALMTPVDFDVDEAFCVGAELVLDLSRDRSDLLGRALPRAPDSPRIGRPNRVVALGCPRHKGLLPVDSVMPNCASVWSRQPLHELSTISAAAGRVNGRRRRPAVSLAST